MGKIAAIAGVCLASFCGACGAQDGSEGGVGPEAAENPDNAPQSFTVRLNNAITAEDVTGQIASAGHREIAAMCEAHPGVSIRIYNPLASGAYKDMSCASMLSGERPSGEASAALSSDESEESIGTAQQSLSPFTIVCGIFVGSAYLFASRALCSHPRARRPAACRNVTDAGFLGLGIACGFM